MEWENQTEATVRWVPPAEALPKLAQLSGYDYLTGIVDGSIPPPPIATVLGFDVVSVEKGTVVFTATPGEMVYNPLGTVHGGFACTLLDTVLGCAGHSTLPAGSGYTSVDLHVQYLRPINAGGRLIATGRVVKPGRRVMFVSGTLENEDGDIVASATGSLLVLSS